MYRRGVGLEMRGEAPLGCMQPAQRVCARGCDVRFWLVTPLHTTHTHQVTHTKTQKGATQRLNRKMVRNSRKEKGERRSLCGLWSRPLICTGFFHGSCVNQAKPTQGQRRLFIRIFPPFGLGLPLLRCILSLRSLDVPDHHDHSRCHTHEQAEGTQRRTERKCNIAASKY